jgi:histone H3/H4
MGTGNKNYLIHPLKGNIMEDETIVTPEVAEEAVEETVEAVEEAVEEVAEEVSAE